MRGGECAGELLMKKERLLWLLLLLLRDGVK
jgi:hypothetical protein